MHGWRRWAGVFAGSAALTAGIAACGGSDDDASTESAASSGGGAAATATASGSDKGVAYATAQVAKYTGLPKFTFDGAPFDMSKIKGKKIFSIPIDSRNPFVASYDAAAKIVAQKYGATWTEYANQGQPNQWSQGIAEAVNQKADIIALSGPDVQLMEGPLKIAKKAGVKVIVGHVIQNGEAVDSAWRRWSTATRTPRSTRPRGSRPTT
jgi:ribose transport system substrate-binding protein